jgi:hypothetical protein
MNMKIRVSLISCFTSEPHGVKFNQIFEVKNISWQYGLYPIHISDIQTL